MEEIGFTSRLDEMLLEFDVAGGCMEFKAFKIDENTDLTHQEIHSEVALCTVENDLLNEENKKEFIESGRKVSLNDFFGNLVDIEKKQIILRGKNNKWNKFYKHDIHEEVSVTYTNGGLGYAFFHTPYTLRFRDTVKEEGDFFFEFFSELLGNFNFLEIYEWSTAFSSYFDLGKEWWGEFYWTVYSYEKNQFIGIIASTTD
ncbi:hypothetical protein [Tenacibaculum amylolyticum]|uniref:hypothetical protein n=1 Tax=Tenacibaculum amylolyticum TaxID=104269 RepID=UPI003892FDDF